MNNQINRELGLRMNHIALQKGSEINEQFIRAETSITCITSLVNELIPTAESLKDIYRRDKITESVRDVFLVLIKDTDSILFKLYICNTSFKHKCNSVFKHSKLKLNISII